MENKKKKKTQIDIILPNFNSQEFIAETIKSIIKQSYSNWKLIIIDDNSNKKTKEILKKFIKNKKIKIYWFKKIFKSKERKKCAPPAPACGLYLFKIKY